MRVSSEKLKNRFAKTASLIYNSVNTNKHSYTTESENLDLFKAFFHSKSLNLLEYPEDELFEIYVSNRETFTTTYVRGTTFKSGTAYLFSDTSENRLFVLVDKNSNVFYRYRNISGEDSEEVYKILENMSNDSFLTLEHINIELYPDYELYLIIMWKLLFEVRDYATKIETVYNDTLSINNIHSEYLESKY